MSTETVKQIIARAMTEPEFKELLFSDSAKALKGYELNEDEVASLQTLSREEFDAIGGDLEERISRSLTALRGHQASAATCAYCQ